MDTIEFQKYLEECKLPPDEISVAIALAQRFEDSLSGKPDALAAQQVEAFTQELIANKENTLPNFYTLARYARFTKNNNLYVAVVDLLDGAEAMGNLYQKAAAVLGSNRRDALFEDLDLPTLGTPNRDKVALNQQVMKRLVEIANAQECSQILSDSLRDLEEDWFQEDVKLFQECQDIEEFLDRSEDKFIAMLEKICDQGGLFFTQKITPAVVDYVRSQPLIARGQREGDILYEVKIPHQTEAFLAASNPQARRYHYCHCPWIKEGLKSDKLDIPPTFCQCSAGFHKKRWEVILGQPLQAEMVESVLRGDGCCKIAIHLPPGL
jgi:hypothetical protein